MRDIEPAEYIQTVTDHARVSKWGASKAMGRAGQYLDAQTRRGSVQSVAVAADLADVCGCDLVVRDRETGEDVARIAPPDRGAGE